MLALSRFRRGGRGQQGANAYRTTDLSSWTLQDLPGLPVLDAVMDSEDDDILWLAFGGYDADARVRRSEDGGVSWAEWAAGLTSVAGQYARAGCRTQRPVCGYGCRRVRAPGRFRLLGALQGGCPKCCARTSHPHSPGELICPPTDGGSGRLPLYSFPPAMRPPSASSAPPPHCGRPRGGLGVPECREGHPRAATVSWVPSTPCPMDSSAAQRDAPPALGRRSSQCAGFRGRSRSPNPVGRRRRR